MPFDDYTEFTDRVVTWMARPDIAADVPDFIRLAEVELMRKLRWRFTSKEVTGNMVADQDYLALPADALQIEHLRIDGVTPGPQNITIVGARQWTDAKRQLSTGTWPRYGRHVGFNLYLTPTPNSTFAYTLWYQAVISPLKDEGTGSNWILANGFDCLLMGACKWAASFIDDDRREEKFLGLFEKSAEELKKLEWRARLAGAIPTIKTDMDPGAGAPRRV